MQMETVNVSFWSSTAFYISKQKLLVIYYLVSSVRFIRLTLTDNLSLFNRLQEENVHKICSTNK